MSGPTGEALLHVHSCVCKNALREQLGRTGRRQTWAVRPIYVNARGHTQARGARRLNKRKELCLLPPLPV